MRLCSSAGAKDVGGLELLGIFLRSLRFAIEVQIDHSIAVVTSYLDGERRGYCEGSVRAGDNCCADSGDRSFSHIILIASFLAIVVFLCAKTWSFLYRKWLPSHSLPAISANPRIGAKGRKKFASRVSRRLTSVLFFTTFLSGVVSTAATCVLNKDFRSGFLDAIESVGDNLLSAVDDLDDIGIPLFSSLSLSSKFNIKQEIHDVLVSGLASAWEENFENYDVEKLLGIDGTNTANLPGSPQVHLNCSINDGDLDFALFLDGMVNKSSIDADITLLPSPMEKLSLSVPEVEVSYSLVLPFTVDVVDSTVLSGGIITKITLGDITAGLRFSAIGNINQEIRDVSASFNGDLELLAGFDYSSRSGRWEKDGSFDLVLDATTTTAPRANVRLLASDDNIYDDAPPTTRFDFDFCAFTTQLKDAIVSLDLTGEVGGLIDRYLIHDDFGGSAIIDPVKGVLEELVEEEVNETKQEIMSKIDSIQCSSGRALQDMEVPVYGYQAQREVSALTSFADLEGLLNSIVNGTSLSVDAGLFPTRKELAVDFVLSIDKVFGSEAFVSAFNTVFDKLGNAQDQLDQVDGTFANVTRLLHATEAIASFRLGASFGIKVENISDFFSTSSSSGTFLGSAFLRVNELGVAASIAARDVDVDAIFPSVDVRDGLLDLSVGFGLESPSEFALTTSGSLESGVDFSSRIGRFNFALLGELHARLPIVATIAGDDDWNLVISFDDDDLFNDPGPTIVFDFNACKILDSFDSMLAKLGSAKVSAEEVLGKNVPTSGIDIFSAIESGIGGLFPDAASFLDGVLEAKNEFYHLCKEANSTGVAPSIEDVISLIREEIDGASSNSNSAGGDSNSNSVSTGRRSLRAHHLRKTQYQRPRRLRERGGRRLQESSGAGTDLVDNLLDGFRVGGGFDGEKIFVCLALDLSKEVVSGVGDLLDRPLQILGGEDAGFLSKVLGSDPSANFTGFDSSDTAGNVAFSASAHIE